VNLVGQKQSKTKPKIVRNFLTVIKFKLLNKTNFENVCLPFETGLLPSISRLLMRFGVGTDVTFPYCIMKCQHLEDLLTAMASYFHDQRMMLGSHTQLTHPFQV
jgi:hypothetical protein